MKQFAWNGQLVLMVTVYVTQAIKCIMDTVKVCLSVCDPRVLFADKMMIAKT